MGKGMSTRKRITKETALLIYGGGEVGNSCYRKLKEQEYYVLAALDQNKAGEHIVEGLYTYRLGTEPAAIDRENCIVVICLANGMLHKEVADKLYSMGYMYIVFLPMRHCMEDVKKRVLTRLYNSFLAADPELLEYMVSDYGQYATTQIDTQSSIIREAANHLTVWMRLEMLFSESVVLWQGDRTKIHTKDLYKDRNIACGNPCKTLFDYFALQADSCDIYFDSKKEPGLSCVEKNQELCQRETLYRLFRREYEKGMDFFIEGAPPVIWNPRNYCNLVGGHHRTLFLLHKGHNLFPVKMKKEDFERWLNIEVFRELEQYICVNKIEEFYAPLPHPCFLNFPAKWEDQGRSKLAELLRYFADCDISGMTVLDLSDDQGYFARNMDRIGAKETTFYNEDTRETELADLLNRLLYRDNVQLKSGESVNSGDSKYDIIFALDREFSIAQLKRLGSMCRCCLIMETTEEGIRDICTYTGLKNYTCIHKEYRERKIWELVVYSE